MSDNSFSPSKPALTEALALSTELLRNIELSEISLTSAALKAGRLARILGDFEHQQMFQWEAGGYPTTSSGVPSGTWKIAVKAGREYTHTSQGIGFGTQTKKQLVYLESIEALEQKITSGQHRMAAAKDPENPLPPKDAFGKENYLLPKGNWTERNIITTGMNEAAQRLSSRRRLIYQYVEQKHYELKYSGIADDVFTRMRERVDSLIGASVPDSVKKLTSIYENLDSDNSEDWSNAVHGCRRVLEDLADSVFPAQAESRVKVVNGKNVSIKLGRDNYVNRIIAFCRRFFRFRSV